MNERKNERQKWMHMNYWGRKSKATVKIECCNLVSHTSLSVLGHRRYMSVIVLFLSHSPTDGQGTEIQATQAMRRHQGHRFDPAEEGADGAGICRG